MSLSWLGKKLGMVPEGGSCCSAPPAQDPCWRALELLALDSPALEDVIQRLRRESKAEAEARRLLGDFLIQFPGGLSDAQLQAVDEVYAAEVKESKSLEALDGLVLSQAECMVMVWRGDICQLAADAVVNAANEEGRGCFQPNHRCIDNVLHRAAGPRLRMECSQQMKGRKKLLPGTPPLVTGAYFLPAKKVLHVTGPQVAPGSRPSSLARDQLRKAYTNCLDAARDARLKSVAFCCISTGLFGYPAQEAAEVALTSVKEWLRLPCNSAAMSFIIFDVFTEQDAKLYQEMGPEVFDVSPI